MGGPETVFGVSGLPGADLRLGRHCLPGSGDGICSAKVKAKKVFALRRFEGGVVLCESDS